MASDRELVAFLFVFTLVIIIFFIISNNLKVQNAYKSSDTVSEEEHETAAGASHHTGITDKLQSRSDYANRQYRRSKGYFQPKSECSSTTIGTANRKTSIYFKRQGKYGVSRNTYQVSRDVRRQTADSYNAAVGSYQVTNKSATFKTSYHDTNMFHEMRDYGYTGERVQHFNNEVIALDCEMVGVHPGRVSALARVSIVSYDGRVLYDKYVMPNQAITDYRTRWSGIRPSDMKRAISMQNAKQEVWSIINNKIIVGHALKNDFKVLEMNVPSRLKRDTSTYPGVREVAQLRLNTKPSLKILAKRLLNKDIQIGEHSSVEDARANMEIYRIVSDRWEQKMSTY